MKTAPEFFQEAKTKTGSDLDPDTTLFKTELLSYLHDTVVESISNETPITRWEKLKALIFGKKFLLSTLALASILGIFSLVFFFSLINKDKKQDNIDDTDITGDFYVELAEAGGNVEYQTGDSGWKKLSSGQKLTEATSIRTLFDSYAILNFNDDNIVRLDSETTLAIEVPTSSSSAQLKLSSGNIYVRIDANSQKLIFSSASFSEISATGTAFLISSELDARGVDVFEGTVKVVTPDERSGLLITEGFKFYTSSASDPENINKTSTIDINSLKDNSFVVWNREQDLGTKFRDKLGILSDLEPPELKIIEPADNFTTTNASILIKGETEKDASITINDEEVANKSGKFELEVDLNEGQNTFEIVVLDSHKNKAVKKITITRNEPSPTPVPPGEITLSYVTNASGTTFKWTVTNITTDKGFKLVYSESGTPSFPDSAAVYISSGSQRQYTFDLKDGKTYNFRLCRYTASGSCDTYSNTVRVTLPDSGAVTGIILNFGIDNEVNWAVQGTSNNGLKIVWSKSSNPPSFPADHSKYVADNVTSAVLEAYDGPGIYYVRVCQYLGGNVCGVYSNSITMQLD